jgi:hypothetical protein
MECARNEKDRWNPLGAYIEFALQILSLGNFKLENAFLKVVLAAFVERTRKQK